MGYIQLVPSDLVGIFFSWQIDFFPGNGQTAQNSQRNGPENQASWYKATWSLISRKEDRHNIKRAHGKFFSCCASLASWPKWKMYIAVNWMLADSWPSCFRQAVCQAPHEHSWAYLFIHCLHIKKVQKGSTDGDIKDLLKGLFSVWWSGNSVATPPFPPPLFDCWVIPQGSILELAQSL